ncbi:MAG: 3-keto-5-aminohexanoate cleavage protein [Flavonifractor plautii]
MTRTCRGAILWREKVIIGGPDLRAPRQEAVPISSDPGEIAASAYDCYNAGAAIIHIHAWIKGLSTNDPKVYSGYRLVSGPV